ncbi:squalene/phytoene synthase family protein [Fretibacter rubidus]|uniref:squalene/phytoene synthase family protein n=1 Tax=Fretibacter rubidus TaxID=570162 RepID=UPI00352A3014
MLPDTVIANVKSVDPDRYRSAMIAPKEGRADLLTLYAFHAELAKVPELVSEPMIGQIRYQWWRDCVDEVYSAGVKAVRKHEVSTPLAEMLLRVDMPRFWVDRLIDGRARDLDPEPFKTVDVARDYAAQTSGVLMQMAVKCLGTEPDEAVLRAGEAWGLTGLARAWGYYKDGILSELDYDQICEAARDAHKDAKAGLKTLPASAFPGVAYAALVPKFLAKLTHSGHDPATDTVNYGPLSKRLTLMGAVMRGNI